MALVVAVAMVSGLSGAGALKTSVRGLSQRSTDATGVIVFERFKPQSHDDIFTVNPDGSGLRQLTNDERSFGPDVSRDGTKIVFETSGSSPFAITTMGIDGTNRKSLGVGGLFPRWSPDGTQVVYAADDPRAAGPLAIVNADGSGNHTLAGTDGGDSPAFTPDGAHIIFGRVSAPLDGIWELDLPSGAPRRLFGGAVTTLDISPSGTQLAYDRRLEFLTVSALDGSGQRDVLAGYGARWSPDGKQFVYFNLGGPDGLGIIGADGSNPRTIVNDMSVLSPSWGGGAPAPPADADHDGVPDKVELALAEQYAPVLFLEPSESNYPVNVDWLMQRMHLTYREDGCTPDKIRSLNDGPVGNQQALIGHSVAQPWAHPDDFSGDHTSICLLGSDKAVRLTTVDGFPDGSNGNGVGDEQTWQLSYTDAFNNDSTRLGALDPKQWVTYVHAYPTHDGGMMLQYWHVFAYNQLDFDNHEGDWDASVQVQLDNTNHLEGVWFSRHGDDHPGTFVHPDALTMYHGTHVEVAVDGGGHAAYASPDDWCRNPGTTAGVHGAIVWPSDPAEPSPTNLHHQNSGGSCLNQPASDAGGTVWQTWTTGVVDQGGSALDHHLTSAHSVQGGLVMLGQCNPGHQGTALLEGSCSPLNGQDFIRYSGQWGTTRGAFGGLPVFSPRGPVFQGFDSSRGIYTAWYNQAADHPRTAQQLPPAASGPIKRVVFVHGIRANCTTIGNTQPNGSVQDYHDLLQPLRASLGAENVEVFCYDDDLGNLSTVPIFKPLPQPGPAPVPATGCARSCDTTPGSFQQGSKTVCAQHRPDANIGPLYAAPGADGTDVCDGNGALAYDASKLENELYRYYLSDIKQYGQPLATAIIGNSMGGAITRGWLRLAQYRDSPTLRMVTTVVFLEPAQQGSWVAAVGQAVRNMPNPLGLNLLLDLAKTMASNNGLALERAGVADLAPASPWYQSVNAMGPAPPRLHYYNFSVDITARLHTYIGTFELGPPIQEDAGDLILLPGSDRAEATPPEGGSRFLPFGSAVDQHQYLINRTVDLAISDSFLGLPSFDLTPLLKDPYAHPNFGAHIGQLTVPSCAAGHPIVSIPGEIDRILNDPANACTGG